MKHKTALPAPEHQSITPLPITPLQLATLSAELASRGILAAPADGAKFEARKHALRQMAEGALAFVDVCADALEAQRKSTEDKAKNKAFEASLVKLEALAAAAPAYPLSLSPVELEAIGEIRAWDALSGAEKAAAIRKFPRIPVEAFMDALAYRLTLTKAELSAVGETRDWESIKGTADGKRAVFRVLTRIPVAKGGTAALKKQKAFQDMAITEGVMMVAGGFVLSLLREARDVRESTRNATSGGTPRKRNEDSEK